MIRSFEDTQAARAEVPLLIGIMGPSGGGKTYSALRLATGIQQVAGGDIAVIDTESRRALSYAEKFKFRHLDFKAPFSPLDYLAAIEHFANKGAKVIVVDSMSHEHDGPGGVLEMHDALMGGDFKKSFQAWMKPKAERRRMINTILQLPIHFIFCFRAKEKLKPVQGGQPKELGFMPIAGEEFVFEMTANCLLLPNAGGVPTWISDYSGEKMMMKLPEQFLSILERGKQLDEAMGRKMAEWARGGAPLTAEGLSPAAVEVLISALKRAAGRGTIELKGAWEGLTKPEKNTLAPQLPDLKAIAAEADKQESFA